MFYPARMKEVSIVVHDDWVDELVKNLHESEMVEITDMYKSEKDVKEILMPGEAKSEAGECAALGLRIGRITGILNEEKHEGFLKKLFFPVKTEKYRVKVRGVKEIIDDAKKVLEDIETKVLNANEALEKNKEKIDELIVTEQQVSLLESLDFDLDFIAESEYVTVKAGVTEDIVELKNRLKGKCAALFSASVNEKNEKHAVLIVFYKDEEIDSRKVFTEFDLKLKGRPGKVLGEIKKEKEKLKEENRGIISLLKELNNNYGEELLILDDELDIERNRKEVTARFGKTESTSVIIGWTPAKNEKGLTMLVEGVTNGYAYCSFAWPKKPEKVPVYMDNPRWVKPFEALTEMFAPPKYDEVDPTMIIAPIFVLFFGFMLGDAVYGAIILMMGLLLLRGAGRISPEMKNSSILLSAVGASTIFFGILQGGYLGDVPARFFGVEPECLVSGLKDPITILMIALIIGLMHINLGLVLAAHQNYIKKDYSSIIQDQVSWWVLQPSFAVIILHFLGWCSFPLTVVYFAGMGLLFGLALLIMRKKGLFFFDFTGFIGNWLSYARLLALGLATAGIAMTVNIIAQMGPKLYSRINLPLSLIIIIIGALLGVYGLKKKKGIKSLVIKAACVFLLTVGLSVVIKMPVLFALIVGGTIFIVGHTFNLGIQALGSFVHSLRLQYVEFFGQFYSGGGKKFKPFKTDRKYTMVEG
ncbi:MAG: V-type ATP synthase subunit I [Thermoplasmatales archaeon]|nr:V-type ATP synthase subunit I [Thermoplasmatales archaeon]